jgi:predicted phosphodiesterase
VRYAVISDIHANLEALQAVLRRIDSLAVDRVVCCGDLVGYYSNPNECIDLIRKDKIDCVRGNHDVAAAGSRGMRGWDIAVKSIDWTRRHITEHNRLFLEQLPPTLVIDDAFLLFHGALHPPENGEDLHLNTPDLVIETLQALKNHDSGVALAFYGHTHRRDIYRYGSGLETLPVTTFKPADGFHYMANPGSVGQPRDGTRDASFLVYDALAREISYHSVRYDVAACLAKARRHRLLRHPLKKFLLKTRRRASEFRTLAWLSLRSKRQR